jgi:hypothetical protein
MLIGGLSQAAKKQTMPARLGSTLGSATFAHGWLKALAKHIDEKTLARAADTLLGLSLRQSEPHES